MMTRLLHKPVSQLADLAAQPVARCELLPGILGLVQKQTGVRGIVVAVRFSADPVPLSAKGTDGSAVAFERRQLLSLLACHGDCSPLRL